MHSPPRVTLEAQRRPALGHSGLKAFDLSTAHPDGGKLNFNLKDHRELATQICEKHDPDRLIGSPPCTDFSVLGRWNHKRMKIEDVRRRLREARRHLEFVFRFTMGNWPEANMFSMSTLRAHRAGEKDALKDLLTGTKSTRRRGTYASTEWPSSTSPECLYQS